MNIGFFIDGYTVNGVFHPTRENADLRELRRIIDLAIQAREKPPQEVQPGKEPIPVPTPIGGVGP